MLGITCLGYLLVTWFCFNSVDDDDVTIGG